ncbi:hypothetical protein [Sinomonas atrocyanea]|uniref:hypothetical protein n=1 Tax=Sinomonas atrocyanea TaxID=37927 RepID=UPI003D960FF3
MGWYWWLLIAAVVAVVLDRLLLWIEGRGWIYYRRRKPKGGSAAMLGVAAELFQPSHTVVVEERDRQRREIVDTAKGRDPGDLPDLGAGPAA